MRIYLLGYMGSGKSATGRKLSELTGLEFHDLDVMFEERFRISIFDFFEKYGEGNFRKIERELLLETGNIQHSVIATGGGTPCFHGNMDFIKEAGKSVYIRMPAGDLIRRLSVIRKKRPLLKEIAAEKLADFVRDQLRAREAFYIRADIIYEPQKNDLSYLASLII